MDNRAVNKIVRVTKALQEGLTDLMQRQRKVCHCQNSDRIGRHHGRHQNYCNRNGRQQNGRFDGKGRFDGNGRFEGNGRFDGNGRFYGNGGDRLRNNWRKTSVKRNRQQNVIGKPNVDPAKKLLHMTMYEMLRHRVIRQRQRIENSNNLLRTMAKKYKAVQSFKLEVDEFKAFLIQSIFD